MWYVYILSSLKYKKSYVGSSDNVKRRLFEHNSGKGRYTKRYKPWKVFKYEEFETYSAARTRENFLKTGAGRKELKKLFENNS